MYKNIVKTAGFASLIALSALTLPALAADENNVATGLTAAGAPLGLHGVDPVAAVDIASAIEGSASHTVVHDGVAYYFSNAANAQAFKAKPGQYIPQNGGFCTYGVSVGKKFDGDPQYASVIDGKLYVFLNEDIYKLYLKDKKGTIKSAAKQWKKIKHTPATEL